MKYITQMSIAPLDEHALNQLSSVHGRLVTVLYAGDMYQYIFEEEEETSGDKAWKEFDPDR